MRSALSQCPRGVSTTVQRRRWADNNSSADDLARCLATCSYDCRKLMTCGGCALEDPTAIACNAGEERRVRICLRKLFPMTPGAHVLDAVLTVRAQVLTHSLRHGL